MIFSCLLSCMFLLAISCVNHWRLRCVIADRPIVSLTSMMTSWHGNIRRITCFCEGDPTVTHEFSQWASSAKRRYLRFFSLNKLLNNQLRWIKIPWRSSDITVMPYKCPMTSEGHSVHNTWGNALNENPRERIRYDYCRRRFQMHFLERKYINLD